MCDIAIAELESEKWGSALRIDYIDGEAAVYKRLLDRDDELRQPNGRGVEYFKRTLRPHFVKGAQTMFLYRFMRFMKNNPGNTDLMKWMTRFQILAESKLQLRRQQRNAQQAALQGINDQHVKEPRTDTMEQAVCDEAIRLHKQQHRDLFPLSQILTAVCSSCPLLIYHMIRDKV